jgi:flagellar M-ring protein FliF
MESLNKASTQIVELFRSLTPAARITTGLLLVAIVVSLAFLMQTGGSSADYYLFGGEVLTNADINLIEGAFAKAQLNDWDVNGNRIRVPHGQKSDYIAAIADEQAYPDTPSSAWERMFREDNLFKPKDMRKLEAKRALELSLAAAIKRMRSIDVAFVQIDEIEISDFPRRVERRASVSVKANGGEAVRMNVADSIRIMVASGGGMERHNVTVTDLHTGDSHEIPDGDGRRIDNIYAKHQQEYENNLKQKILERLSNYSGIKVAVHATLDTEVVNQEQKYTYDPKSTSVESRETTKETTSSVAPPGGRVGAVPNGAIGNNPQVVSSTGSADNTMTERTEEQRLVTGATLVNRESVGFTPTWMTVSIGLPRSYFKSVWQQRNPVAPGEDPKEPDATELRTIENEVVTEIESAVTPLLPKVAQGEDPYPRVAVVPYTEMPQPMPAGPAVTETALQWLSYNWRTIALFAMAIIGVLVLRGMIRNAQTSDPAIGEPASATNLARLEEAVGASSEDLEEEELLTNSLKERFSTTPSRSLREELTELVREDPAAAASVLEIWIGDAV